MKPLDEKTFETVCMTVLYSFITADIILTEFIIIGGGIELNPLLAWLWNDATIPLFARALGSFFYAVILLWVARWVLNKFFENGRFWAYGFLTAYYAPVVVNNVIVLKNIFF